MERIGKRINPLPRDEKIQSCDELEKASSIFEIRFKKSGIFYWKEECCPERTLYLPVQPCVVVDGGWRQVVWKIVEQK